MTFCRKTWINENNKEVLIFRPIVIINISSNLYLDSVYRLQNLKFLLGNDNILFIKYIFSNKIISQFICFFYKCNDKDWNLGNRYLLNKLIIYFLTQLRIGVRLSCKKAKYFK